MRGLAAREGIAVDADARAGGEFSAHAGIAQRDRIIAGMRDLALVIEARAIAVARRLRVAGFERNRGIVADRGHDEEIAQITMPGTREMGVAKTLNGRVFVAVAGGVAVARADDAAGIGVGRELDHAERRHGAGIGVSFPAGADERVDGVIGGSSRRLDRRSWRGADQQGDERQGDAGSETDHAVS